MQGEAGVVFQYVIEYTGDRPSSIHAYGYAILQSKAVACTSEMRFDFCLDRLWIDDKRIPMYKEQAARNVVIGIGNR